ncbi:helix-turn-helix domain-containing protein [Szabonella alba]|uniref:Helix-turn-helix transcriptional regulator n=1 Tax=Szabonella alba TaxID=2804194 RepID=A0A8K0VBU6_9RHOB|nr:helix-turn-helix transcriptional regulator [Szabonella alba]MBL4919043.1 helix-turn-helix transcriptional regulator [Szabonella alba]
MSQREHINFPVNLRRALSGQDSLTGFSGKIGISRQQLARYLSGAQMPTFDVLKRISMLVGVSSEDLLSDPSAFEAVLSSEASGDGHVPQHWMDLGRELARLGCFDLDLAELQGVYEVFCLGEAEETELFRGVALISKIGQIGILRCVKTRGAGSLLQQSNNRLARRGVLLMSPGGVFFAGFHNLDGVGQRFGLLELNAPADTPTRDMTGFLITRKLQRMTPLDTMRVYFRRLRDPGSAMRLSRKIGRIDPDTIEPEVMAILTNHNF